MLSFEVKSDEIQIYCDQKGLESLIKALERLRRDGDHIHLNSPSCGGRDIDDNTPWNDPAVGMVTINWFEE